MMQASEPYPIPDHCNYVEQDVSDNSAASFNLSDEVVNLLSKYQFRVAALIQLVALEWKLSLHSLFFGLLMTICFSLGLVVVWIGINVLIGFTLVKLGLSFLLSMALVLFMQGLFLLGLWRSIKDLSKHIGFSKTYAVLKNKNKQLNGEKSAK